MAIVGDGVRGSMTRGAGGTDVFYRGLLNSDASWARVGCRIVSDLPRFGLTVRAQDVVADRHKPNMTIGLRLVSAAEAEAAANDAGIVITFEAPDAYPSVFAGARRRIGILVWEASLWPSSWIDAAKQWLDLIIVPSHFCAEGLRASALGDVTIMVVPHGIETTVFRPEGRIESPRECFTCLFVGTPAWRKGVDLLAAIFRAAFAPNEAVRLIAKIADYDDIESRPYLVADWRARLTALINEGYNVEILTEKLGDDDLAALYRSADVVLHPFRGEGFCLPLLEASACGTPAITTQWGGPLDFLTEESAFLVHPRGFIPAAPFLFLPQLCPAGAVMAAPDAAGLARALRLAKSDVGNRCRRGSVAASRAIDFAWTSCNARLATTVKAMLGRPPKRG
jgi:glycosyltransferase involved in cell wall biosynthesis